MGGVGPTKTGENKMANLQNKINEFKTLYQSKDPFAALTDCHADWERDNNLTEKLCILKQDILAVEPGFDFNALVKDIDDQKKKAAQELDDFNRKHSIEMMYLNYERQYGWEDLDKQDARFERQYGDLWLEFQDDIWEKVCPAHRAKKYAEQAIADSKIVEVCHD